MSKALRLGLVGAGAIGVRGVLEHLSVPSTADDVVVAAICDVVAGRASEVAARYGVSASYEDLYAMLASDEVDAVTLATPIGLHYEQGMAAIEAGKHVHFHKTMATSLVEASDLIEAAQHAGVCLVASPGQMAMPHNRRIKALIEDGAIGEVAWALTGEAFGWYHESESERTQWSTAVSPAWYWRKPGGGPLYDMTVYGLHTLTGILGSVESVTAVSGQRVPVREFNGAPVSCDADDNSFALLDFGSAVYAVAYGAAFGTVTTVPGQPSIFGSAGSVIGTVVNGDDLLAPGVWPYATGPHVTPEHAQLAEAHVFEDVMQLVDYVRDGQTPFASAEHARHVIEVIELIYAASESGTRQPTHTTIDGVRTETMQ
jgi:predicted dehydrogenase